MDKGEDLFGKGLNKIDNLFEPIERFDLALASLASAVSKFSETIQNLVNIVPQFFILSEELTSIHLLFYIFE